jgi:hypothetical protein
MKLKDYLDEWEKDAPIDKSAMDDAARKVPVLHAKWWRYYSHERLSYRKLDIERRTLYKQLVEYYGNKMLDEEREKLKWEPNARLILSGNMDTYIDADIHMQEHLAKLAYAEEVLKFLESVIGSINKRGYDIKNAIEFAKFSMGV